MEHPNWHHTRNQSHRHEKKNTSLKKVGKPTAGVWIEIGLRVPQPTGRGQPNRLLQQRAPPKNIHKNRNGNLGHDDRCNNTNPSASHVQTKKSRHPQQPIRTRLRLHNVPPSNEPLPSGDGGATRPIRAA